MHGKPALVISHNKTLAAQLYSEFKAFFANNAVEYFVCYYNTSALSCLRRSPSIRKRTPELSASPGVLKSGQAENRTRTPFGKGS